MKLFFSIILLFIVLIGSLIYRVYQPVEVEYNEIVIAKGESLYQIIDKNFDGFTPYEFRLFLKFHPQNITILPGNHIVTSPISKQEFINILQEESLPEFRTITILPGRSSIDVDHSLSEKDLILPNTYREMVINPNASILPEWTTQISNGSLEGLLYPDTYFIDPLLSGEDLATQLIKMQLDTFSKRIWQGLYPNSSARLTDLNERFSTNLSMYDILILASIVHNEERKEANKSTVAAILLQRIRDNDLIGADITICYGLGVRYDECYESLNYNTIRDSTNVYNTRARRGLPPTPIGSFLLSDIEAVLNAEPTPHYFYLHDSEGNIHYARTNQEHNQNKIKYIQ